MKRRTKRALSAAPRRTSRCAVVHSLDAARSVLAAAGSDAVTLISPSGAAAYMGVGYFWALIEAVRAEFPGATIGAVMDCGDAPGWALSALRTGFKTVVLRGDPRARVRVAAIARGLGARILTRSPGSGTGRRRGGEKKGFTTKARAREMK